MVGDGCSNIFCFFDVPCTLPCASLICQRNVGSGPTEHVCSFLLLITMAHKRHGEDVPNYPDSSLPSSVFAAIREKYTLAENRALVEIDPIENVQIGLGQNTHSRIGPLLERLDPTKQGDEQFELLAAILLPVLVDMDATKVEASGYHWRFHQVQNDRERLRCRVLWCSQVHRPPPLSLS